MNDLALGQWWQRLGALAAGGLTAGAYLQWQNAGWSGWWLVASAIAFFLLFLMSIPVLYQAWMRFAEKLSVWIVRTVFSIVYLVLLPILMIFVTRDRLGLKRHRAAPSLWIDRPREDGDLDSMRRMG